MTRLHIKKEEIILIIYMETIMIIEDRLL